MTATVPVRSSEVQDGWVRVCSLAQLDRERGVAALIGDRQVALFRTHADELFAVDNRDPFSGAMVLCRGIVGTRETIPTVACPMYKQVFDLRTGQCLDDPTVSVRTYPVRLIDGDVEVSVPGVSAAAHRACSGR